MKLPKSKLTLLLLAALLTSSCSLTGNAVNTAAAVVLGRLFPLADFGLSPDADSDSAVMDVWVAEMASDTAMSNFQLNPTVPAAPVNILAGKHAGGITAYTGLDEGRSTMYLWHDGTVEVLTGADGFASLVASIAIASGTVQSFTVAPDGAFGYAIVAGSTKLYVVDLMAKNVAKSIDFGTGAVPNSVAVSPDSSTVYVLDGGPGSYHTVNPSTGTYTTTIYPPYARLSGTAAVTPDGTQLWMAADGIVLVWDTLSNTLFNSFRPGQSITEIVFSLDGTSAYILISPPSGQGAVLSYNTQSVKLNWQKTVGTNPHGLTLSPFGSFLMVANSGDGDIEQISSTDGTQMSLTDVGMTPVGVVAFNEPGS